MKTYKLFIVDDDAMICKGLSKSINWSSYNIEIVGYAYNGEDALENISKSKPDIVISDINMPFLNGIELTKMLSLSNPNLKIILLTAFQEFKYAKDAVKAHAFDYITKPFSNETIIDSVLHACSKIENEAIKLKSSINEISQELQNTLNDILIDGYNEDSNILTLYPEFAYDKKFTITAFFIKSLTSNSNDSIHQRILDDDAALKFGYQTVLKNFKYRSDCIILQQCNKVIIINFINNDLLKNDINKLIEDTLDDIQKNPNVFIICCQNNTLHSIKSIKEAYDEVIRLIDNGFSYRNGNIINKNNTSDNPEFNFPEIKYFKDKINEHFILNEIDKLKQVIIDLEQFFNNAKISISAMQIIVIDIILMLYNSLSDDAYATAIKKNSTNIMSALIYVKQPKEIIDLLLKQIDHILLLKKTQNVSFKESEYERIIQYINNSYTNPKISLKFVANSLNIGIGTLCVSIKKYGKSSFIEILTNLRIEYSKKLLLETNNSIYDIAFLTGYNSAQYFNYIFKKNTNLTPSEYRFNFTNGL